MDRITNVQLGALPADSPYMKPFRLHFTQNGKEKNWGENVFEFKSIFSSNLLIMELFRPR